MGRRRGAADDIMDLVALLPWWAGVSLACVLYLVLHHVASLPSEIPPTGMRTLGESVQGTMWRSLATVGQYALPLLCLFGALASAVGRGRRRSLYRQASAGGQKAIANMGWKDFERLTHEIFLRRGFKVIESRPGPDGGIDLQLHKDGRRVLVQCKRWSKDVGVKIVRELYGVMTASRADAGIVVSSSGFTAEAQAFADSIGLELIDGAALERHLGPLAAADREAAPPLGGSSNKAECPVCGSGMLIRTARRGSNAGNQFWGCQRYPECRGTRPATGS
jgi:restriction system protein